MALAFRQIANTSAVTGTSIVINKPTGTASGDFLLAHLFINGSTLPSTVPDGWAEVDKFLDGGIYNVIYSLTAGGSEPSSYEWDWLSSIIKAGVIVAISGTTPGVDAIDKQANASSTTRTWKSVTTSVANTFLVFFGFIGANTSSAPDGGEDERLDAGSTRMYCMTTAFVGPGATGTHTASGASSATSKTYTVAVAEAVAVPATPSGLSATANGTTQIDLAWTDNASTETAYSVERSATGVGAWSEIATPAANATSYSDTGLSAGTQYWYRVRANNAGVYSGYSGVADATTDLETPNAPTAFTATAITASRIDLSWEHDGLNLAGFSIERSTNGMSGWAEIATPAAADRTYSDTGLPSNTERFYRMRAFNE